MSRKGHYNGGGTIVRHGDPSWFTHTKDVPLESGLTYVPERTAAEQRAFEKFKQQWEGGKRLIPGGAATKRAKKRSAQPSPPKQSQPPGQSPRTPAAKKLVQQIASAIRSNQPFPDASTIAPELHAEIELEGGLERWAASFSAVWQAHLERQAKERKAKQNSSAPSPQPARPKAPVRSLESFAAYPDFPACLVGETLRIAQTVIRVTGLEKAGAVISGVELRTGANKKFQLEVLLRAVKG